MLHAAFFLNNVYVAAMNAKNALPPQPAKELLNGGIPNYKFNSCFFFSKLFVDIYFYQIIP